jgi:hypothetical protein
MDDDEGVTPSSHLYRIFVVAPWVLEPIPFWRAVYGYIHSLVVSRVMPMPVTISLYGELFADELKTMYWAPLSALPEATKKRVMELVFSEPLFGIGSGRGANKPPDYYYDRNVTDQDDDGDEVSNADPSTRNRGDEAREEVVDEVVRSIEAHRHFLQQTLRWLYVNAAPTWLAVEFDKNGVKYEITRDDLARVFTRSREDIAGIQFALAFGPDTELRSILMTEVALRTDNVAMLELMGRLPAADLLVHALEVGAHKVIKRVLVMNKGRGTFPVHPSTVRMAVEMREYELLELFMDYLPVQAKEEVLEKLTKLPALYGRACRIILDSISDELSKASTFTAREFLATTFVHNVYVSVEKAQKRFGVDDVPKRWKESVLTTLRLCLAKYNMVDESEASWFAEMVALGLGNEAKANRAKFAEIIKQRKLKVRKQALKEREGRGRRK